MVNGLKIKTVFDNLNRHTFKVGFLQKINFYSGLMTSLCVIQLSNLTLDSQIANYMNGIRGGGVYD